jgi:hypothetical protein
MNRREENEKIFKQKLNELNVNGYLPTEIVEKVLDANNLYRLDLVKAQSKKDTIQIKIQEEKIKSVEPRPVKVRKTHTPEEMRERNITWSLNIGVIFLLIGGLFVATSNWETMTSLMKSGSIAFVSLLFYGIAFLAKKILRIDKTAFAFIVLGSLFLPIFILSLGWFGLLGSYLSVSGEGRYILGILGSLIPVVIYARLANLLASRLFVWFTYIFSSAGVAFVFAALKLDVDLFYLGIMAYNALLIFLYTQIKNRGTLKLFTNELVPFIQANLVLSTLFMLVIYDNHLLYSLNLLLTAVIYLSMIYVTGRKEFHFVFSIMIVYGAYQLIEHSILESFGAIIYAFIGFGMVFVPKAMKGNFHLEKAFQFTSAVISGMAFIYITLEGMFIRMNGPSVVLMFAYFIISGNFTYLAKVSKLRLFSYLSSFFLASAIYEGIWLFAESFIHRHFPLAVFFVGFTLFIIFGMQRVVPIIQESSRDIGNAIMVLAIGVAFAFLFWWELGVMLMLLAFVSYLLLKKEKRLFYKEISCWILPYLMGLSTVSFGEEISSTFVVYQNEFGPSVSFVGGAVLVLLCSLGWKKMREETISRASFYASQIFYTIGIVLASVSSPDYVWVQPSILLIGIGMYYLLKRESSFIWAPYLVSITTLLFYFSIFQAVDSIVDFNDKIYSYLGTTGAVFLFLLALMVRKKDMSIFQALAWTGHVYYPLALGYTWISYNYEGMISYLISLTVYIICTRMAKSEWSSKYFLYSSFTTLFVVVTSLFTYFNIGRTGFYEFLVTSIVIILFGLMANKDLKKRTAFYAVPFSIIGLGFMIMTYPFGWIPYLLTIVYSGGILVYLHKLKWDLFGTIPLLIGFIGTVQFIHLGKMDEVEKMLLSGLLGMCLILIGKVIYKKIVVNDEKIRDTKVDGYTLVSFLYLFFMYYFESDALWTHVLPGVLISISIWLQQKRVPTNYSYIPLIIGMSYLLEPYYSTISMLKIPDLWDREVVVLPWVVLVILVRRIMKGRYSRITSLIQWFVLIVVSLLLIEDGLESSTIYDAIILGSLSLFSMLIGMFLRIKSYFFVGAGVLMLNVLLQTRPYWGNMPWWGYLLISGSILIGVASSNEWHKQKSAKGEKTFISIWKEKIVTMMKRWD